MLQLFIDSDYQSYHLTDIHNEYCIDYVYNEKMWMDKYLVKSSKLVPIKTDMSKTNNLHWVTRIKATVLSTFNSLEEYDQYIKDHPELLI